MIRRQWKLFLVLAFSSIAVCALLAWALSDAPAEWLVVEDAPGVVDAIVVFAGDPDYERTTTAARILLSGGTRILILTGGEPGPGDSSDSLRSWALRLGVPTDRMRIESRSHSTREAVLAVKPILRRVDAHKVGLVTSPYHQRRAFLAAQKAWTGVDIYNWPANPSWWSANRWWRNNRTLRPVISEYVKILYYTARGWISLAPMQNPNRNGN